ncbi:MAG: CAP domain-containing protein, partial [Candidatus Cloacimonadaceae bacterium]|nr:CAP domain-containing protein [Candidatus Cloacimonadaceae bacterium]
DSVVTRWLKSPTHRDNLLNPGYTYHGMGIVFSSDKYYITHVFARPHVKLISPLDDSYPKDGKVSLTFEYMLPENRQGLVAILEYPDPSKRFYIDKLTYFLGKETIKPVWRKRRIFELNITFSAGAGAYHLSFGREQSILGNSLLLRVE